MKTVPLETQLATPRTSSKVGYNTTFNGLLSNLRLWDNLWESSQFQVLKLNLKSPTREPLSSYASCQSDQAVKITRGTGTSLPSIKSLLSLKFPAWCLADFRDNSVQTTWTNFRACSVECRSPALPSLCWQDAALIVNLVQGLPPTVPKGHFRPFFRRLTRSSIS